MTPLQLDERNTRRIKAWERSLPKKDIVSLLTIYADAKNESAIRMKCGDTQESLFNDYLADYAKWEIEDRFAALQMEIDRLKTAHKD